LGCWFGFSTSQERSDGGFSGLLLPGICQAPPSPSDHSPEVLRKVPPRDHGWITAMITLGCFQSQQMGDGLKQQT